MAFSLDDDATPSDGTPDGDVHNPYASQDEGEGHGFGMVADSSSENSGTPRLNDGRRRSSGIGNPIAAGSARLEPVPPPARSPHPY